MKLRTEFQPPASKVKIDFKKPLLFVGSCFAENIGKLLVERKFDCLINPFGISYNPISLFNQLAYETNEINQLKLSIQESDQLFFHFDLHSDFNALTPKASFKKMEDAFQQQLNQMKNKPLVFLSLGTAWVHELKEANQIVNNCHKQPSTLFNKRLLAVAEIASAFDKLNLKLTEKYKETFEFVFTVSPVRHLKDGFRENQLSKSTLHLAVETILQKHANTHYFPAYELLQDDLRDYRFYNEDLVHPSSEAVKYIWSRFKETHLNGETTDLVSKIESVLSQLNHKAFHAKSEKHQQFLSSLLQKLENLQREKQIDFQSEIQQVKTQLLS